MGTILHSLTQWLSILRGPATAAVPNQSRALNSITAAPSSGPRPAKNNRLTLYYLRLAAGLSTVYAPVDRRYMWLEKSTHCSYYFILLLKPLLKVIPSLLNDKVLFPRSTNCMERSRLNGLDAISKLVQNTAMRFLIGVLLVDGQWSFGSYEQSGGSGGGEGRGGGYPSVRLMNCY
ncbi:hypothetical protein QTP88_003768 [Uroleucon formosanum]